MKTKAQFSKTVDILVKAYLNDTLQHADCSKCAVGNIVNACFPVVSGLQPSFNKYSGWASVFVTDRGDNGKRYLNPQNYTGLAKIEIDSTGYSWEQLSDVEHAFEMADKGNSYDEYMFNGLMAVVDVLADIHQIDLKAKEEAKLLFVRP